MPDTNNSQTTVDKITTPITPLEEVAKINEIIDAIGEIQTTTTEEIFGGIIGDSTDNEVGGGTL